MAKVVPSGGFGGLGLTGTPTGRRTYAPKTAAVAPPTDFAGEPTLAVEFDLPLLDEYDFGDAADVFYDWGSGTVDYSRRLNSKPIPLFSTGARAQGYGAQPYGLGLPDGRADRAGNLGVSVLGTDPYGEPAPVAPITVDVPRCFGDRKFGVKVYGPTGDATGTPFEFQRFIASDEPPPIMSNELVSYDAGADRVTLSWTNMVG